ncbi:MAG TPA: hypothetical protein VIU62_21585 [Chloroflexota bacterium]
MGWATLLALLPRVPQTASIGSHRAARLPAIKGNNGMFMLGAATAYAAAKS